MKGCLAPLQSCTNLHIDFISAKDNRNVLADTLEIAVPVGNILVGDARGNIEHDDTTLALNVVTISETTKLLLASSVPDVEADGTVVRGESERMNLDTEGG